MTKVCHLTSAHPRYDVRIFEKECVSLSKYNFEVNLIVNDDLPNEVKSNVNIISTGYTPKNRLDRIVNSKKKILKLANDLDADVYHLHDPELLPLIRPFVKKGKKVIFDAHEDTAEQIMDKEWIPYQIRRLVSLLYSQYSKKALKRATAIITVTPQLVTKFSKFNRTVMVTNYPILSSFKEFDYIGNFNSPTICFAGGISEQWRHKEIINAIEGLPNVKYVLAGNADSSYLEQLKTLNGWKKVDYLGKISHSDVESIQKSAVAGMAINYANQIKGQGTLGNTKLFEYMAAGIPVICTNYILWEDIINKNGCGITVDPNSTDEIKKAIQYILDNPKISEKMGKNGRIAVEKEFSWANEEVKLIELYKSL